MSQDPSRIGRYEVVRVLGEGAMGRVFLAMDPLLKRWVAVKVIRERSSHQGEFMARFQREAELSARLNHPNLITVHDVGEDPVTGPYLAMEYIEGTTLDKLLLQGPLAPETAMDLLIQAMEALEATHALGILHRDLKPSNLLVSRDGRLRLLDFGIAREQDPNRTATANYLGTPAYAAPELLKSLPATEATDRWSFAVTAFECLTGRQPFAAETLGATLFLVSQGTPKLPVDMPADIQALLVRALDPDPGKRPVNLRKFLTDLLRVLQLEPEDRRRMETKLGLEASAPTKAPDAWPIPVSGRAWGLGLGLVAVLGVLWWAGTGLGGQHLKVVTIPPGAQISINGTLIGRSPLSHPIQKEGSLRIRAEKEDFWPMEKTLGAAETTIEMTLSPTPFFVDVITLPPSAEVLLDGKPCGRTPLLRLQVPGPGHNLQITLAGRGSFERTLTPHQALPNPIFLEELKAGAP